MSCLFPLDDGWRRHLRLMVSDSCYNNWFSVKGTSAVALPLRGTKPGDSAADLLFNLAYSPVLREVSQRAEQIGGACCLPRTGCFG